MQMLENSASGYFNISGYFLINCSMIQMVGSLYYKTHCLAAVHEGGRYLSFLAINLHVYLKKKKASFCLLLWHTSVQ